MLRGIVALLIALGLTWLPLRSSAQVPPDALPSPQKRGATTAAEQTARGILAGFDKNWKAPPGSLRPLGDPAWKVKVEAFVGLVRAGASIVPVLEEASKENSPWPPWTRELAAQALEILRGPAAPRQAVVDFDLAKIDTAHPGQAAPDFSLADLSGTTYRLKQFRGQKIVVLVFIVQGFG